MLLFDSLICNTSMRKLHCTVELVWRQPLFLIVRLQLVQMNWVLALRLVLTVPRLLSPNTIVESVTTSLISLRPLYCKSLLLGTISCLGHIKKKKKFNISSIAYKVRKIWYAPLDYTNWISLKLHNCSVLFPIYVSYRKLRKQDCGYPPK